MQEEDWEGELVGVDYSEASVQLARQIANQRRDDADDRSEAVRFEQWDILNEHSAEWLAGGFDAVLDKGTFDAISLSSETDAQGRRICETYRDRVTPLIKKGGLMIITSCNWTKEEVMNWFVVQGGELEFFDEAKYPTFRFGGQVGQSVCTLIFRKL